MFTEIIKINTYSLKILIKFTSVFVLVTWLAGCVQFADPNGELLGGPNRPIDSNGLTYKAGDLSAPSLFKKFSETAVNSHNAASDANNARLMLKYGHAIGKTGCIDFFDLLGRAQQKHDIDKDYLALGSNVATGILGLIEAGEDAIIGSALGFESLESNLDIRQIHVLFNPDTKSVEDLVLQALDLQIEHDLQIASAADFNYAKAYSMIINFERICRVHYIKSLVNGAIERGELEAVSRSSFDEVLETLTSKVTTGVKTELGEIFKRGSPISETQLVATYWYFIIGYNNDAEAEAICNSLKELQNSPCDDSKPSKPKSKFESTDDVQKALGKLELNSRKTLRDIIAANINKISSDTEAEEVPKPEEKEGNGAKKEDKQGLAQATEAQQQIQKAKKYATPSIFIDRSHTGSNIQIRAR